MVHWPWESRVLSIYPSWLYTPHGYFHVSQFSSQGLGVPLHKIGGFASWYLQCFQFGHFLVLPRGGGWSLTASSLFCPHQAPAACCVYCSEWHLSAEIQEPSDFPKSIEVAGAESQVQSGGSVLIPVATPTLPCRGFW